MAIRGGLLCLALGVLAVSPVWAETFQVYNVDFDKVPLACALVGSFNNWDSSANPMSENTDGFVIDLALADGEYSYGFWMSFTGQEDVLVQDQRSNVYTFSPEGEVHNLLVLENGTRTIPTGLELFEWPDASAEDVVVAGDFNGWFQGNVRLLKNGSNVWQAWLDVGRPVVYKYVVDDLWKSEPSDDGIALVGDDFNNYNNIRMPDGPVTDPPPESQGSMMAALDGQKASPFRVEPMLEHAMGLAKQGDYSGAVMKCREARGMAGSNKELALKSLETEADIHRLYGKNDRAAGILERVTTLSDFPTTRTLESRYKIAKHAIYGEKDYAKARSIYQELLQSDLPVVDKARLEYDVALSYMKEKDRGTAQLHLNTALERVSTQTQAVTKAVTEPDTEAIHLQMEILLAQGECYWYARNLPAALDCFEQIEQMTPWPKSQVVQLAQQWSEFITLYPDTEIVESDPGS